MPISSASSRDRSFVLQTLDLRRSPAIFDRLRARFEQEMMNHLRKRKAFPGPIFSPTSTRQTLFQH